ncbi:MAG: iron-containing alcohol dehydrogenase [Dermatophilaceae bacterium]
MGARFDLGTPADVRFGAGRASEAPAALAALGVGRVLLVTGRSSTRSAAAQAALAEAGMPVSVFPVEGEPSVELVREALDVLAETGSDGVLGFGGGSAMDVAKALAALAPSGADPMEHLEVVGAGRPLARAALPCVAVPTTAGTGSEVTRNAVLSSGGVKASLRGPTLLPRVALVDPDLLDGLPRPVIAASGMDALSQLLEPFLSRRANPLTDALAREGMRRSARSLRRAWQDGTSDPAVREDLALASLFGGLCLANAGLGAVHGFAAALGARLGAPHGAVCAALLAATTDVNLRALRSRAPQHPALARLAEVATLSTGHPAAAEEGIAWLRALTAAMSVGGLRRYGLDEALVPAVVSAARQASSMRANPIELTDDELREILLRSF